MKNDLSYVIAVGGEISTDVIAALLASDKPALRDIGTLIVRAEGQEFALPYDLFHPLIEIHNKQNSDEQKDQQTTIPIDIRVYLKAHDLSILMRAAPNFAIDVIRHESESRVVQINFVEAAKTFTQPFISTPKVLRPLNNARTIYPHMYPVPKETRKNISAGALLVLHLIEQAGGHMVGLSGFTVFADTLSKQNKLPLFINAAGQQIEAPEITPNHIKALVDRGLISTDGRGFYTLAMPSDAKAILTGARSYAQERIETLNASLLAINNG